MSEDLKSIASDDSDFIDQIEEVSEDENYLSLDELDFSDPEKIAEMPEI